MIPESLGGHVDAVKPGATRWTIKEQIVRAEAIGISLQFEVIEGRPVLRITGDGLPVPTIELGFTIDGKLGWTEAGSCCNAPTWIKSRVG